jgi:hypothetical protein
MIYTLQDRNKKAGTPPRAPAILELRVSFRI